MPMLASQSKTAPAVTAPNQIDRFTLESSFANESERKIGVELELYFVDRKTGEPMPIFDRVRDSLPDHVRNQIADEHLSCQIEIVSNPCRSLRELRDQMQELIESVECAANRFGAKLLWSGSHPTLVYDDSLVTWNARTIHHRRRWGALSRQFTTSGVHFHIGVTRDEVIRVIDGMQAYVPLLVALSANSPIMDNRETGRRSQRAAIWSSGFPVCGLSGPFGSWELFNERIARLSRAKRIDGSKDLYDFVRPTRHGTVEIRCCDTPADLDQVIALAALVQTLVVALARGEYAIDRDRDLLRAEMHDASMRGPESKLLDAQNDLVSPQQWLARLAYEMQPVAREKGSDLALRLAPAVLADNGSSRQLQALASLQRLAANRSAVAPVFIRKRYWKTAFTAATVASLFVAVVLLALRTV